jgi:hypothetical protein
MHRPYTAKHCAAGRAKRGFSSEKCVNPRGIFIFLSKDLVMSKKSSNFAAGL